MTDECEHPTPLRLRDPDRLLIIEETYFKHGAKYLVDKARFLARMREMTLALLKDHYDLMGPEDRARADATIAKLEAMK